MICRRHRHQHSTGAFNDGHVCGSPIVSARFPGGAAATCYLDVPLTAVYTRDKTAAKEMLSDAGQPCSCTRGLGRNPTGAAIGYEYCQRHITACAGVQPVAKV